MGFGLKKGKGIKSVDKNLGMFELGKGNMGSKDLFNVGKNAPEIPISGLGTATSKKRTLRKLGRKEGNRLERISKRGV